MRLLNFNACSLAHLSRLRRGFCSVSIACLRKGRFSTHARASSGCVDEAFSIAVGNNGILSLRVTQPPAASQFIKGSSRRPGTNVILYLAPGPLFQDPCGNQVEGHAKALSSLALPAAWGGASPSAGGHSFQHLLASVTAATVVTVNYRLGFVEEHLSSSSCSDSTEVDEFTSEKSTIKDVAVDPQPTFYQYPTPIHDTLAGFDWIQSHLQPTQLGVVGSHIGGSLALMLALTEAQSVRAVAALEPVCDWPGLDEYCTFEDPARHTGTSPDGDGKTASELSSGPGSQRRKRQPKKKAIARADLVPLLKARERFFSSPERSFDAFASPILFLRSAGRDVPRTFPEYITGPEYPVPVTRLVRQTGPADSTGSLWDRDVYPLLETDNEADTDADNSDTSTGHTVRRRKALSRWPPYGLDYGLSGRAWSGPGHGVAQLQMTLPWVRIFLREEQTSTSSLSPPSSSDLSTSIDQNQSPKPKETSPENRVLSRQADEMVSVMRRACFWGQEKGVGERRVTLSRVPTGDNDVDSSDHDVPGNEMGDWLKGAFEGSMEED